MASPPSRKKKEPQGTILLRQAEPKYKFVGRKLPKEPKPNDFRQEIKSIEGLSLTVKDALSKTSTSHTNNPTAKDLSTLSNQPMDSSSKMFEKSVSSNNMVLSQGHKPVAVVGASFPARSPLSPSTKCSSSPDFMSHSHTSLDWPSLSSSGLQATDSMSFPQPSAASTPASKLPTSFYGTTPAVLSPQLDTEEPDNETNDAVVDDSVAAAALSSVTSAMLSQRLAEVEKERDQLKKDFDSQLQVNSELKRLLIASVGDDLSKRVERLAQDRVQLSMDIGGFSKKMNEDYENLDKISIQADMWRSKYLASRVMVEELGNARAYFSLQCHESQEALQQLLNERHELRTNLLEAYKILQQVKDAFDPLNSHRSSSLLSTNVLDLSRACQQLGEAVRFRLLPAHVSTSSSVEVDLDPWENSVTRAEQYAHELLSRPSEPAGSLQSGSSCVLPITRSPSQPHINRFHPHVKHENVTIHCCHKCKGEISVV